jgi:excisionase family DNA binding protein
MKNVDFDAIKTLDPKAVFSLGEVAKLLGKSHNGVRLWVKQGKIKYGKIGSRYFITGAEIQNQMKMPDDQAAQAEPVEL